MLHKDNHINFSQALRPFDGYELDYLLGTSYSLSLEALMFIPVTLFFGEEFSVREKVLTSEMFEALNQVPSKVQFFCQRGKMIKPSFYHEILAFWEDSIEQIHLQHYNQSFHPKIWLIRYASITGKTAVKYKFICTSRNLTLCHDWDAAVTMDGIVTKKKNKRNQPLLEFVEMLDSRAIKKRIKTEILAEIPYIKFQLSDEQLAYAFHPIGFGSWKHPLMPANIQLDRLLIMSPFLQEKSLQHYRKCSRHFTLLSNGYQLDRMGRDMLSGIDEVYLLNPLLERGPIAEPIYESDISTELDTEPEASYEQGTNLHAKIYIVEAEKQTSWFLGSANCTDPATERNIEFLTEIKFDDDVALIDDLMESLVHVKQGAGMFIDYDIADNQEIADVEAQYDDQLRRLIHGLASLKFVGQVVSNSAGRFDVKVEVQNVYLEIPADWEVHLQSVSS